MANDAKAALCWRGSLDISQVIPLHEELVGALEAGVPIEVDAAGVERIDTSAIQLLCAFIAEARERSIPVSWTGCSDSVRDVAKMLNLFALLNLEIETEQPIRTES